MIRALVSHRLTRIPDGAYHGVLAPTSIGRIDQDSGGAAIDGRFGPSGSHVTTTSLALPMIGAMVANPASGRDRNPAHPSAPRRRAGS